MKSDGLENIQLLRTTIFITKLKHCKYSLFNENLIKG